MNIDFHFGVVWLVARIAGLSSEEARTVAHACQYVDDSTVSGPLVFADASSFLRFASAHKLIDYRNELDFEDKRVWLPFHFIPGGFGADVDERMVCRPDSQIAREAVRAALAATGDGRLHRLGVTLHAYVDTWAHQGFSGVISSRNQVADLSASNLRSTTIERFFGRTLAKLANQGVSALLDVVSGLGHGAALHLPDMPWVKWSYTDGDGREVTRVNLPDFIAAADRAHAVISAHRAGRTDFEMFPGLPADGRAALEAFLRSNTDHDEEKRLARLSAAMAAGRFPGIPAGEALPDYIAKGPASWKERATGIADLEGDGDEPPVRRPDFESSDYFHFHEAVKAHLRVLWTEILPRHDIPLPEDVALP